MQTPWGEIAVADAHVHFFSHAFFEALAAQAGKPVATLGGTLDCTMPPEDPEEFAAAWVRELDRNGVARAVLIASAHGDEGSVAAAVRRFPNRFWGYFMLNPLAPDALGRAAAAFEAGLRGVCLFPAMHAYPVQDDRVRPVFELAAAHPGAAVFVHCGVLTVGIRDRLGLPSPFDMQYSNPIHLHGIALRYPRLPIVVPHFGAGYFREALMLCGMCPNVYLDTSSSNSWMRYQPEEMDLRRVFRRALEVAGPQRLLFGTDSSFFPRGWNREVFTEQVSALQDIGADAAEVRSVLGENLVNVLAKV